MLSDSDFILSWMILMVGTQLALTQSEKQEHSVAEQEGGSGGSRSWLQTLPPLIAGDLRQVTEPL